MSRCSIANISDRCVSSALSEACRPLRQNSSTGLFDEDWQGKKNFGTILKALASLSDTLGRLDLQGEVVINHDLLHNLVDHLPNLRDLRVADASGMAPHVFFDQFLENQT
jgi:hypothetical protein